MPMNKVVEMFNRKAEQKRAKNRERRIAQSRERYQELKNLLDILERKAPETRTPYDLKLLRSTRLSVSKLAYLDPGK
jgi:hypothetical protein